MKTIKKKKITSKAEYYLPSELLMEMLARLPVKSLVRFKSVSKKWLNIIQDPNFIYLHQICYKNNYEKTHIFVLQTKKTGGLNLSIRLNDDLLGKSLQDIKLGDKQHRRWVYLFCSSISGLILMQQVNDWKKQELKALILWNPSIRRSVEIPLCPFEPTKYNRITYALGYASNGYKVLAIQHNYNFSGHNSEPTIAVYALNDGFWRTKTTNVKVDDGTSWWHWLLHPVFLLSNGGAHWLACDPQGDCYTHVLSFDFNVEEFSHAELPFEARDKEMFLFLFLLGDSVSLLGISHANSRIWIMEKNNGWANWYSGDSSPVTYNFFADCNSHYDSTILYIQKRDMFFIKTLDKLYSFDVKDHQIQKKYIRGYYMDTHVESLALSGFEGHALSSFL